jgi:hypothetical protein
MKYFKTGVAAAGFTGMLLLASCSDRNNTSDTNPDNEQKGDTSVTDTRRYSTDTVNYLTKDSSKSQQDVIDPNPPPQ